MDKVQIFMCGGQSRHCTVPGCSSRAGHTCEFEFFGRKAGQLCGLAMCDAHAEPVDGKRLCPSHRRLVDRIAKQGRTA